MIGHPPEILASLGSWTLRTYGVILAIAFFVGFWLADRRAQQKKLGTNAGDVFFWGAVGGLIGARLGFVFQELDFYLANLREIPLIWHGGLSFHGGLIGGVLAGLIYLGRIKRLHDFWLYADAAAAALLLSTSLGRLGNWANQELYGYPTTLPWAIAIDPAHRLPGYENFVSFHPTFAYEALLNVLGLFILIFLVERKKILDIGYWILEIPRTGTSFLFVVAWYGLARGITEIWRISDRIAGPLSLAQVLSIGLILASITLFLHRKRIGHAK